MESIKSEKFNKLAKNEIFGKDKIFGGIQSQDGPKGPKPTTTTSVKSSTHEGSSTWLGFDDDNSIHDDAVLVPDGN